MSKYHIDKNGKPALCKATERPCPLGGDDTHFPTIEEAQTYVDEKNAEKFGIFPVEDEHADGDYQEMLTDEAMMVFEEMSVSEKMAEMLKAGISWDEPYHLTSEELNEVFVNPADAAKAVAYGKFDPEDDFFRLDGYGNLESLTFDELDEELLQYKYEVAKHGVLNNTTLRIEAEERVEEYYNDYKENYVDKYADKESKILEKLERGE